ncbi:hypothetical protein IMSHALPRED_008359 [Imshaugia aleurites]|uniref:Uncharacterized protein n=1 Tax=Imshaugia aleurites TaxID=172621 RepID=A0A8H3ENX8_9LECA|nr:hypothetical protein IMSHALPRED_008359 [Imshaugia aleurites]
MNSDKGDSVNEGGALLEAARQVKILEDGTVHVIYTSYAAYNHDQQLLKAAKMTHDQVANASSTDRLTSLPTEVQLEIMRYLIPNRGRIAIGVDYLTTRWNVLYNNIDQAHSIDTPLGCFEMLVFHTPAHLYLTRLEVMIDTYGACMGYVMNDDRLLKALQHAKGLRELELFVKLGTPDIIPFLNKLGHIRSIKVFSWSGKDVLYEIQIAKRNKDWVQPRQTSEIS